MKKNIAYSVCLLSAFCCFTANASQSFNESNQQTQSANEVSYENDLRAQLAQIQEDKLQLATFQKCIAATNNEFNKIAYRIAGLDKDASDEYQKYSTEITQKWQVLCDSSLMHIRSWAQKNIDPLINHIKRVLYVFGGPDIAYPCQFFSQANEYILIGLEPLGDFKKIKQLVDSNKLDVFRVAASSYLTKGFFITSEMLTQLSKSHNGSNGGLGMILLQLARMNYDIVSINTFGIEQNGELSYNCNKTVLSIIKIDFKKDAKSDETSTIYYIRMDLSNNNVNKLNALMNFSKQRNFITFVKSASYALQDRNFTTIRNFILNNTEAILQDDTGISFRILKNFDIHIFGQYIRATLPIFKNYTQHDMVEYFKKHTAHEIGFKIGYGFNLNRPALILAIPPKDRKIFSDKPKLKHKSKTKQKTGQTNKAFLQSNILKRLSF